MFWQTHHKISMLILITIRKTFEPLWAICAAGETWILGNCDEMSDLGEPSWCDLAGSWIDDCLFYFWFLIVVIKWNWMLKSSNIWRIWYGETTLNNKRLLNQIMLQQRQSGSFLSSSCLFADFTPWSLTIPIYHDTMLWSQCPTVFFQVRLTLNDTLKAGVHLVIVPGETPSALAKMFWSILTPTWNDPWMT